MLIEQTTKILRVHLSTEVSKRLRFSHRVEFSWADSTVTSNRPYGVSFYQDVRYRVDKLTLQGRWTQFEVPDYTYRLYEFETDLPGNFRNILLNDRGLKWFFLINYKISPQWNLALKYREIYYPDEETVGSGLNTVLGNRKKELRAQVQIFY